MLRNSIVHNEFADAVFALSGRTTEDEPVRLLAGLAAIAIMR
jgi:hypothetical protein